MRLFCTAPSGAVTLRRRLFFPSSLDLSIKPAKLTKERLMKHFGFLCYIDEEDCKCFSLDFEKNEGGEIIDVDYPVINLLNARTSI